MTNNIQKPIEKKSEEIVPGEIEKKEEVAIPEKPKEADSEISSEKKEEQVSEKIETARKTISTQAAPAANVSSDAQSVADIQEFEKKVEKLVEIAFQKGPEHAIKVAQHMDKGKDPAAADNYTLDEIHDQLMEEELRGQLVAKGLLKEL